jgi:uncharacterized protein YecT (DUF1311 family)
MLRLSLFALLLTCSIASAQNNAEQLMHEVAKKENVPVEEVRREWTEGCESGFSNRMVRCSHYRAVAADIELNHTYQALQEKLETKEAKQRLKKAQKAWLTFLATHCSFDAVGYWPGTDWEAVENSCTEGETKRRTEKLKEYLSCEGGGCPE